MLRWVTNRVVGALLLALFIVIVGGCGSSGQVPLARTDTPTATVSGIVLDRTTGLAATDAIVRIGSIIVRVDDAGEFIAVVPPGALERSVGADGYQTFSDTVTVVQGDNDLGAVYLVELPPPPPAF